jgi:hypothetical protein
MTKTRKATALTLALLLAGTWAMNVQAKAKKGKKGSAPKVATQPLDDGKLIPTWFNKEGLAFVEIDEVDYFWALEGFSYAGKTFHFEPWPEPEFLGKDADERDENDRRLARQMNSEIERSFADTWSSVFGSKAGASTSKGDILVEGRIVDCSTGNNAAKFLVGFGAGAGYTTIDLKFKEKATGKLVAAAHHRVVSGTSWSTTDSKFFKWIRKFAERIVEDDFGGMYEDGEEIDE